MYLKYFFRDALQELSVSLRTMQSCKDAHRIDQRNPWSFWLKVSVTFSAQFVRSHFS